MELRGGGGAGGEGGARTLDAAHEAGGDLPGLVQQLDVPLQEPDAVLRRRAGGGRGDYRVRTMILKTIIFKFPPTPSAAEGGGEGRPGKRSIVIIFSSQCISCGNINLGTACPVTQTTRPVAFPGNLPPVCHHCPPPPPFHGTWSWVACWVALAARVWACSVRFRCTSTDSTCRCSDSPAPHPRGGTSVGTQTTHSGKQNPSYGPPTLYNPLPPPAPVRRSRSGFTMWIPAPRRLLPLK